MLLNGQCGIIRQVNNRSWFHVHEYFWLISRTHSAAVSGFQYISLVENLNFRSRASQSLLESLTSVGVYICYECRERLSHTQVYDGLRLRALPALYAALQPGTDDDRMKGALWTLNISSFGESCFLTAMEFI